jgi:hypothetical protein
VTAPAVARPWPRRPAAAPTLGAAVRDAVVAARRIIPAGAALLTVLAAHAAIVPHLVVQGAGPDVVPAAVVAVAAGRGSRAGAAFGFAAGLGAARFLTTPFGTTALAYTLVGHAVGRAARGRSSSSAAAVCGPASTCFSCRTGRRHGPAPTRARQRTEARRRAIRRSLALTALGVGAGGAAATGVATALGGVPYPGPAALIRTAAVAALSAPLGPLLFAAVRRLRAGGAA